MALVCAFIQELNPLVASLMAELVSTRGELGAARALCDRYETVVAKWKATAHAMAAQIADLKEVSTRNDSSF